MVNYYHFHYIYPNFNLKNYNFRFSFLTIISLIGFIKFNFKVNQIILDIDYIPNYIIILTFHILIAYVIIHCLVNRFLLVNLQNYSYFTLSLLFTFVINTLFKINFYFFILLISYILLIIIFLLLFLL